MKGRECHLLWESCDFLCKWAPGIPSNSFTLRSSWVLTQTRCSQAHLLEEICDFLCKWAPKGPQAKIINFICKWGPGESQAHLLEEINDFLFKWGPQAHLLEEINDFLWKWAPGSLLTWKEVMNELMGILRLIYLTTSLMSYANGLLGFPGLIYLKES